MKRQEEVYPTTVVQRRGEGGIESIIGRDGGDDECKQPDSATAGATTNTLDNSGVLTSPPTEAGSSVSGGEDECGGGAGGWLGGIGSDFRTLAVSLQQTAGDVVGFVHRSAVNIATEISELEHDQYDHHHHDGEDGLDDEDGGNVYDESLRLPWEVPVAGTDGEEQDEFLFEEDTELKEKILQLSYKEETFLEPYSQQKKTDANNDTEEGGGGGGDDDRSSFSSSSSSFVLNERRIQLIRQLLAVDNQLARIHARLSGRSNVRETIFWRNYFWHCQMARQDHIELQLVITSDDSIGGDNVSVGDGAVGAGASAAGTSDTSSYVCVNAASPDRSSSSSFAGLVVRPPLAPNSLNSAGMRSVLSDEGLVVIDSVPQPQSPLR